MRENLGQLVLNGFGIGERSALRGLRKNDQIALIFLRNKGRRHRAILENRCGKPGDEEQEHDVADANDAVNQPCIAAADAANARINGTQQPALVLLPAQQQRRQGW